MKFKLLPAALLSAFLMGCATPLPAPQPTQISPSLMAPCPPYLAPVLTTWGDLATAFSELLADHRDCRARHRALANAIKP